jgi:flagellar basal-body rod protein FlgC
MGLFDAINAAGSALTAERLRMDVTAENLANAQTTRGADGQPYRRKEVVLQERDGGFGSMLTTAMGASSGANGAGGVEVAGIVEDQSDFKLVYDPGHPDADAQGYVSYPNIDLSIEYVNALEASRAYEANVSMMEVSKAMINASLRLIA